ncbi:DUF393 domain-containing protein [Microbacterium sp. VKM Ac-2923]|nr:DUF393 domain-containing protein [Microbacterium sp. VKM Ac-2923]
MNPQLPLLVYDGDCAFCATWVQRLSNSFGGFHAEPWQWLNLDRLGLTEGDVMSEAWLVAKGQLHRGHAAFAALLRMQPQMGWKLLGSLVVAPPFSWIFGAGYSLVARHRDRLPGGTPTCAMRPPTN